MLLRLLMITIQRRILADETPFSRWSLLFTVYLNECRRWCKRANKGNSRSRFRSEKQLVGYSWKGTGVAEVLFHSKHKQFEIQVRLLLFSISDEEEVVRVVYRSKCTGGRGLQHLHNVKEDSLQTTWNGLLSDHQIFWTLKSLRSCLTCLLGLLVDKVGRNK